LPMRAKQVELGATMRVETGKSAARKLRAQGQIPAVVYGRGIDPMPVTVDATEFTRALPESAWRSTLINLKVAPAEGEGKGKKRSDSQETVIIAEVQRHPVRQSLLAVDFHRISLKETIRARVPVVAIGESPGVKLGGVLEQTMHEVEVECLPTALPDHVEADISNLEIGDTFRVKDLGEIPDATILSDPEDLLLVVAPPTKAPTVEAAPEEIGAVVTEAPEPEVIGEKKEEEEEKEEGQ